MRRHGQELDRAACERVLTAAERGVLAANGSANYPTSIRIPDRTMTFRAFDDYKDANKWGEENWGRWIQDLKPADKEQIEFYCGNYFRSINSFLRQREHTEGDEHLRKRCAHLSSILQNAPRIPESVEVYRFISKDCCNAIRRKHVLHDTAFQSCTLVAPKSPLRGPYCLRFVLPKGTAGAYVEPLSKRPEECELLLPSSNYTYHHARIRHDRRMGVFFIDCVVSIQPR